MICDNLKQYAFFYEQIDYLWKLSGRDLFYFLVCFQFEVHILDGVTT